MRLGEKYRLFRETAAGAWLKKMLPALLLFIVSAVQAQHVIPLPSGVNDNLAVCIDSVRFASLADADDYGLQFRFVVIGDRLPREERIVIRPLLTCGDSIAAFPPIEIDGLWVYYHHVRSGSVPDGIHYRSKDVIGHRYYSERVAVADWMQLASLSFQVERTNACGDVLHSDAFIFRAPVPEYKVYREEDVRNEEVQSLQGSAYVSFPVNRSVVQPDFRNNAVELERLRHTIDSVSRDTCIQILRIQIKGFASPEGPYANNDRLARERTSSLTRYIIENTEVSPVLFHTAYEAEDWDGLRAFVDTTALLTNREALLQIIDSDSNPDDKLSRILKNYPEDYKTLNDVAFPLLRHTDYQINYTQKNVTSTAGTVHTDTIYRLQADTVSLPALATDGGYKVFRPLLAVKTNLLYDLLLAPNIEAEIPFGRNGRWSLMAEYTNPWWRWKKLDYSYEIQEGGLELRRWLTPRCDGSRPWLSGMFAGVYGAVAKYDIENNTVGDQGDVWSVGATWGYSWPIGRQWNLEFSVSAGYIHGERRHYNAEFDSTHLIYKYTKDVNYFGPTKLKVSLVWIIPWFKKHKDMKI